MLIKQGTWRNGALKYKHPSKGWSEPNLSFVKQNGLWVPVQGRQVIVKDLGEILVSMGGWEYHSTRGWYRNSYNLEAHPSKLSLEFLSKIRKVSAVFTNYYDNPSGGMGANSMLFNLSNGESPYFGVRDAWVDPSGGQNIYKGDAGVESRVMRNVIGERYTYTVPVGTVITSIYLDSRGYADPGINYLFAYRGMRDFEFTLQH